MYIKCKVVSNKTKRIIEGEFKPIQLLQMTPSEIVDSLNDVECTCNTENGYNYCGCGEEFEDCILFVDGELVKEMW